MVRPCRECRSCHDDLDLETAMGTIQRNVFDLLDKCDKNASKGDVCELHRLAKSYEFINSVLKQNGLLN